MLKQKKITVKPICENIKRPQSSLFAVTTRYYFLAGDASTYINDTINPDAETLLARIHNLFTIIGVPALSFFNKELDAFNIAKFLYPHHSLTILELRLSEVLLKEQQVYFNLGNALVNIKSFSSRDTYEKGKIIPFDKNKIFPQPEIQDTIPIQQWRF